jgi:hypothetical protein
VDTLFEVWQHDSFRLMNYGSTQEEVVENNEITRKIRITKLMKG